MSENEKMMEVGYKKGVSDLATALVKSFSIGTRLWDSESIRITIKLKAESLRKKAHPKPQGGLSG